MCTSKYRNNVNSVTVDLKNEGEYVSACIVNGMLKHVKSYLNVCTVISKKMKRYMNLFLMKNDFSNIE